jgi:hypothetical protein
MPLRIAEAQQLADALSDPLLRPGLIAFFHQEQAEGLRQLVQAIRLPERDTMKEAQLAGKVEVYETALSGLEHFAEDQLRQASQ